MICLNAPLLKLTRNVYRISTLRSALIMNKCGTAASACNGELVNDRPFCVLPAPLKSQSDKKDYRVIQLKNGLIACLISDPTPILTATISRNDEDLSMSDQDDSSVSGHSDVSDSSMEVEAEDEADEEDPELDEEADNRGRQRKKHPEQKMAAAGLCVGVGSFSDPKEVPGMAHFLEHMVFMGSEKYEKENAFDEFIKHSGGSDNASTDVETTVFYFECLENRLSEGLDRFSQFFIAPLMKREAMTREREAIESEFQTAITSDGSRKEQLFCNLAKEGSPVNCFSWGNLTTLKTNIDDDALYFGVHSFRKRHYSAHRMTLAVQSRASLDDLQQYILDTFSNVPTNDQPPDDYREFGANVFDTPDFCKIYYIIPVKQLCQVDITWAFPSLLYQYKSKPQHVLSWLLGDEGKGSLLAYLKKNNLAIGTSIGTDDSGMEHNSLYTLFTVSLNLTESGYSHVNDAIEAVFSYLRMLRERGIDRSVFNEIQSLADMSFKYQTDESAADTVEILCEAMQHYPPEHYLAANELYFDFDPELIAQLVQKMVPEKANYMLLKQHSPTDAYLTEKWFGTRYLPENIPASWLEQWQNAPLIADLTLPLPNAFITRDFSILPDVVDNPEYPLKIMQSPLVECFYRRDTQFKLPIAYYRFYLISPLAVQDEKHCCMLDVMVNLLSIEIAEEAYPATSANLTYSFANHDRGLVIKVGGFNEKLPTLIELIAKYIINLNENITEVTFEAIKDKLVKSYYNKLLKPEKLSKDIRLHLLMDKSWHPIECYKAMGEVSLSDMRQFSKLFFDKLYVKALVQGNVTETVALSTVNEFVKRLNYQELKSEDRPITKVYRVPKGEACCRIKSFNPGDPNSIITNYYQASKFSIAENVKLDLIMMIIKEPLFDILRTKEQLGYDVSCSIKDTLNVLGFTITVNAQATKVSTKHVDERIEAFLQHTRGLLDEMNDDEFAKIKTILIKMKRCADVQLAEEVDRNWSEIVDHDYLFDRIQQEIIELEKVELKSLIDWWARLNSFGDRSQFRKLSIQVQGFEEGSSQPTSLIPEYLVNEEEGTTKGYKNYFIQNLEEYRKNVEVYHMKM